MIAGRIPYYATLIVAVFASTELLLGADMPAAPPLSTLVAVEDLTGQIEYYVEEIEECVEDAEEYEDSTSKLEKCVHTLSVVALTVGLHDRDSKYKRAAPALIKACQELARAKNFVQARASAEAVKAALGASGDPAVLKWVPVAGLPALMDQVPLVNTRLKRYMRRFERGAEQIAGGSAALVAISQGSMANHAETEAPDKVAQWYKYCIQMRDAASDLNKAVHNKDEAAGKEAMTALQQSCDDCHAVFHTDH